MALSKVGVLPSAATVSTEWVLDAPVSKRQVDMEVSWARVVAMTIAAPLEARIRQLASSWKKLVVCSIVRVWSRRAARSASRLVAMVAAMILAAITREWVVTGHLKQLAE